MPKTSTASIISAVAIGRRMKVSEIFIDGSAACLGHARRRSRRGLDLGAGAQAKLAVDDDLLARCQPGGDDRLSVLDSADLHRAALDALIGLDDIGVIALRPLLDR